MKRLWIHWLLCVLVAAALLLVVVEALYDWTQPRMLLTN
jgi:hypothetical protein